MEPESGDTSEALDLVTLFSSDEHNAEMQAMGVRAILEAGGIPAVIVGSSVYPNLPFEVRVPKAQLEEARLAILEAQAAGPDAAEEAEGARQQQHRQKDAPAGARRVVRRESGHPLQGVSRLRTPGAPIRRSTGAWPSIAQGEAPMRTKISTRGSLKPGERSMSSGSAAEW